MEETFFFLNEHKVDEITVPPTTLTLFHTKLTVTNNNKMHVIADKFVILKSLILTKWLIILVLYQTKLNVINTIYIVFNSFTSRLKSILNCSCCGLILTKYKLYNTETIILFLWLWWSPRGVVANVLDCDIIVSFI